MVGIPNNSMIILAMDTEIFRFTKNLWPNVFLLNETSRSFGEICTVKQLIWEAFISFCVEVTVLDGDVFFLSNPVKLFFDATADNDFTFQLSNWRALERNIPMQEYLINIGVVSVVPSARVLEVLRVWRTHLGNVGAARLGVARDQKILQRILYSGERYFDPVNRRMTLRPR
jgi:hypothetical protein